MATLLKATGDRSFLAPANGISFTLAELHAIVGGYIEVVSSPLARAGDGEPLLMVLNEDGKRLELPANALATHLLHPAGGQLDDVVVGDVLLATLAELEGPEEGDEEP